MAGKREIPSEQLRPFLRALSKDPNATKELFAQIDSQAKANAIPAEVTRQAKAMINDAAVDYLSNPGQYDLGGDDGPSGDQ